MKCIKCLTKNIDQANYCKKCGYEFNDKEREIASRWTPVWVLKKIESFSSFLKEGFKPFKFITDTRTFKILSLLAVLGLGIYSMFQNGRDFSILSSADYTIEHNGSEQEYYLIVKEKETNLNMYVPNYIDEIVLKHYDEKDNILNEETYENKENFKIVADLDDYYVLSVKFGDKTDDYKLLVYMQEVTK